MKVCVITPHANGSEGNTIISPGIKQIQGVVIVKNKDKADFVVTNCKVTASKVKNPKKRLIYIDYKDNQKQYYKGPCALYAKRSIIKNTSLTQFAKQKRTFNLSYCLKDTTKAYFSTHRPPNKTLQIACMHSVNVTSPRMTYRSKVAQAVSEWIDSNNVEGHVGHIGQMHEFGRRYLSTPYLDILANSKFVVTCNPDLWEGDYRLYEALGSGALVFVDKMYSMNNLQNPLKDKVHLLYYDRDNLSTLKTLLVYYMKHPNEAKKIADRGYKHALKFYRSAYVMESVISKAKFASTTQNYRHT